MRSWSQTRRLSHLPARGSLGGAGSGLVSRPLLLGPLTPDARRGPQPPPGGSGFRRGHPVGRRPHLLSAGTVPTPAGGHRGPGSRTRVDTHGGPRGATSGIRRRASASGPRSPPTSPSGAAAARGPRTAKGRAPSTARAEPESLSRAHPSRPGVLSQWDRRRARDGPERGPSQKVLQVPPSPRRPPPRVTSAGLLPPPRASARRAGARPRKGAGAVGSGAGASEPPRLQ